MADGSAMKRLNEDEAAVLSLGDAIARLEADEWRDDDTVDLGDGLILKADGPMGAAGLLQRLRGHLRLLALVGGAADAPQPNGPKVAVHEDVKALLDAVKNAG